MIPGFFHAQVFLDLSETRDRIMIEEQELTEELLDILIRLSVDWEAGNSCYGYRKNEKADIEGNRIFIAKDDEDIIGYLFGHPERSERSSSIMADGTPVSWISSRESVGAVRLCVQERMKSLF